MTYTPILPKLKWLPSPNSDVRGTHPVDLVVIHRWGASSCPLSPKQEDISYGGVINWFEQTASQVSSHFVFPGSAGGVVDSETGQMFCTQMVAYKDFAWAEAAYNPVAVEVESADDIWLDNADPDGKQVLARIVAFLLHEFDLPAVWSTRKGFCRHGDLGIAGGGHLECPVGSTAAELVVWKNFITMVKDQTLRGDFLPEFGR